MTGCWVSLGRLSAEWVSEGGVATSDSWGSVPRRRGDRASRLGFRNGKRSRGNGDSRVANSSVRGLPQAHSRQLRELHADYVSLRVATDAWLGQRRSQVRRVALPELLEQVHARVATVCRLTRCQAHGGGRCGALPSSSAQRRVSAARPAHHRLWARKLAEFRPIRPSVGRRSAFVVPARLPRLVSPT